MPLQLETAGMTFFKKLQPFPNITCSRVRFGSEITLLHKIAIHLLRVLSPVSNKKIRNRWKCSFFKIAMCGALIYDLGTLYHQTLKKWSGRCQVHQVNELCWVDNGGLVSVQLLEMGLFFRDSIQKPCVFSDSL